MNRLNPLYIIALALFVAFFSLVKLQNVKTEIQQTQKSVDEKVKIAKELGSLKKVYSDKTKIKRALEKILRYSTIQKANISKEYRKSGVTLKVESINLVALNALMGKLLNGSFAIEKLNVKRLSDKKATLEVGIKW